MSTTRPDITVPQDVWTELYALSGIPIGTQVQVLNKTSYPCRIAISALAPTTVEGIDLPAFPEMEPIEVAAGSLGLWAYATSSPVKLLVQEKALEKNSNGALWTTHIHPKGMDFYTAVGLGLVPGVRRITALGSNTDIDQGTLPEEVWSAGGVYPWMTAATALEIISTSTSDSAAGIGARTVIIFGLDANYVEVTQTVTLDGTTPVAIPTQLLRVNSALIASAGTNKVNVGDINIRRVVGGTIQAQIPVGYGVTRQAIYTVPAGHTLSVHSILYSQTRSGGVERTVTIANYIQSPLGFYRMPLELSISQTTPYRHDGEPGINLPEKTDFAFRVTSASSNDSSVTVAFLATLYSAATLALV